MATKKDFFAPESTSAEKYVYVDPNVVAQTRTDGTQINEKGEVVGNAKTGSIVSKKAKTRRKKKAKKKEPKLDIEFDDQSFLWDHIDLFGNGRVGDRFEKKALKESGLVRFNNDANAEAGRFFLYKNFLQIKDDQPLTTKNKLFAMGIDALNSTTNAELSSIVPYFKLFKVLPQQPGQKNRKRIEFPFNKYTTMDSILQSRENRGTDVGLKNVKWEDTGANPGNVGLAFKGSMTLHFQSFEGIFKTRKVDGEDIRFADIMHLESLTGRGAAKNKGNALIDRADSTNVNCNTVTEIHMECGWTLPPDKHFKNSKFGEQLRKLRRTYIITPIDQNIKVTNNGAVDMDVTFCAGIEGRTFGAATDLLGIDETNDKNYGQNIAKLKADIKSYRESIKKSRSKKANNAAKADKKNQLDKKELKQIIDERKALKEKIDSAKSQIRSLRYQRLLSILRTGSKNRIFYIDLDPQLMSIYTQLLRVGAQAYNESKEANKKDKVDIKENFQSVRSDFLANIQRNPSSFFDTGSDPSFTALLGETSSQKENADATDKKEKKKDKALTDGKYRLHYIYLGDIVEAVMEIMYNNPQMKDGKIISNDPACPVIKTEVRVLLGSFSYLDPGSGDVKNMQLCDVPISFDYFNSWWYDNVIKAKKNNYPLRSFLRDMCGSLLNNVMSPKRYGGMPGKRLRCAVQSVFTKKSHPLDLEWKNNKDKKKERVDIQKVFKNIDKGSANQYSQWLYVYVAGGESRNSFLNGKIDQDLTRNIPHYFVGGSTGVIKDINFTKTKIPGKRESLIYRSVNDGPVTDNLLFSDRYDAKVRLLGNPIFKPGMLIYVDPRAMGLGSADSSGEAYMSDLGIGGYYRVVRVHSNLDSSKFETELDTISEYSSREIMSAKRKSGAA
jgi:hypothetical protein